MLSPQKPIALIRLVCLVVPMVGRACDRCMPCRRTYCNPPAMNLTRRRRSRAGATSTLSSAGRSASLKRSISTPPFPGTCAWSRAHRVGSTISRVSSFTRKLAGTSWPPPICAFSAVTIRPIRRSRQAAGSRWRGFLPGLRGQCSMARRSPTPRRPSGRRRISAAIGLQMARTTFFFHSAPPATRARASSKSRRPGTAIRGSIIVPRGFRRLAPTATKSGFRWFASATLSSACAAIRTGRGSSRIVTRIPCIRCRWGPVPAGRHHHIHRLGCHRRDLFHQHRQSAEPILAQLYGHQRWKRPTRPRRRG